MRSNLWLAVALGVSCFFSACLAETRGSDEIAALEDGCPGNVGTGGQRYDATRNCLERTVLICAVPGNAEAHGCARDGYSGDIYKTAYILVFDLSDRWQQCTDQEQGAIFRADPPVSSCD